MEAMLLSAFSAVGVDMPSSSSFMSDSCEVVMSSAGLEDFRPIL